MMTEREVEPIIDKLLEAENMLLAIIGDDSKRDCWHAAADCKLAIWRAMDKVGDLAPRSEPLGKGNKDA